VTDELWKIYYVSAHLLRYTRTCTAWSPPIVYSNTALLTPPLFCPASPSCPDFRLLGTAVIMSTIDNTIPPLEPIQATSHETEQTLQTVKSLGLQKHIEGGYFAEIDRNPLIVPNPFNTSAQQAQEKEPGRTALLPRSGDDSTRNASTSIYYMLTGTTPLGSFHRNKGRTVHTLISGRGRYVLIHADEEGSKKRVETFVVGHDFKKGEKAVWIVEGGKFKASFLLPGNQGEADGLLISEVCSYKQKWGRD
jgi:uncharacterized protein